MDGTEGELFLGEECIAVLSAIQLADAAGQPSRHPQRWMASIPAGLGLQPDEQHYVLETITWKYLVSLDFRDEDFDEQPLVGGRILNILGQATTQLMPSLQP